MLKRIVSTAVLLGAVISVFGQSPFVLNVDATEISCNCYQLTPEEVNQHGSVWNVNQLDLTEPFDMTFQVYLGDLNGWGADGMAFVLQQGTSSVELPHGNPGYHFLDPSVAVEVDIFLEPENDDPGDDHLAVMSNGSYDHASANNLAGPVDANILGNNIDDGNVHDLRIVWDPVNQDLAVYFDIMVLPRLVYNGDIINDIFGGDPIVHWGFTAGTGGIPSEHRVCFELEGEPTASETSICAGDSIDFSATGSSSLGDIEVWSWDFDNGETSTDQAATAVFDTAGDYTVTQTVSDLSGCEFENTVNIQVEDAPDVDVSIDHSCEGVDIGLENLTTGAQSYQWTFSDGQTSTQENPAIIMAQNGMQSYNLVAASPAGCVDSTSGNFYVNPVPEATLTLDDHCLGYELPYDLDTTGASSLIGSVQWSMGDGDTLNSLYVTHTYDSVGTYEVVFEIATDSGCVQMVSQEVEVNGTMPEIVDIGDTIYVTNGPFVSYQWYINGNAVDGATDDSFVPTSSGNISVVATDPTGCSVSSYNIEFTTTIGISEVANAFDLELMPNPNNGEFWINVDFGQSQESEIIITDMLGRTVIEPMRIPSTDQFKKNISVPNLERGTYILKVVAENGEVVRPFVVSVR